MLPPQQVTLEISSGERRAFGSVAGLRGCGRGRRGLAAVVCAVELLAAATAPAQEPVRGDVRAHDPSTIVRHRGRYYLFSTGKGILTKSSPDLVHWTAGLPVFAEPPPWTTNAAPRFRGHFWAPDVISLNGRYLLYYSVSTWGSQVSAIGLATNSTLDPAEPAYGWTDEGPVIQSTNGLPYNAIDPGVRREASGNLWMVFGSYWSGIKLVQLDPATGKRLRSNSPIYSLAYHPAIEAPSLFQRGGYFYLFINWDACARGVDSTYNIRVGRSRRITGPYLDRDGRDLMSDSGTLFLESTGRYIGPGHAALFTENGADWCSYHYYDGNDRGVPKLALGRVSWTADGWPILTNDWQAFYSFEADAGDERGEFEGVLRNGAAITNVPGRGGVLDLNGFNQYVSLPLSVANARTLAAWVLWRGGEPGQRVLDFGAGTNRYFYLTPKAGANGCLRFVITPDRGQSAEQVINAPAPLPVGAWTHVAVTLDGQRGILYTNGRPVGTNSSLTFRPCLVLARNNYIGRGQGHEPCFNGQLDSLCLHGRALGPEEIARLAHREPPASHD